MSDWRDKIRNPDCELCPLHEEAEYVCLMGDGPRKANIMIVGEAPGEREDDEHRAFVGPAGQLLNEALRTAGIKREEVYITNAAKCHPPKNRTPTRGESKICTATYLTREVEKVRPDFILAVGNAAMQAVVGRSGIKKHRGHLFDSKLGPSTFVTYHPAAVLRNPGLASDFAADLARFARLVRGESSDLQTRTKLINTGHHLGLLIKHLMGAKVICFDIETYVEGEYSNLEEWHGEDSQIVSIGFSTVEGQAFVVPLHHPQAKWRDPDKVLEALKPTLQRSDAKYVAHNAKFDMRWLAAKGVFVSKCFDTMTAAHMLNENRSKGLKQLSQVLLGADAYDLGDELENAKEIPIRRLAVYNGKDCDYTIRLYRIFKEQFRGEPRIVRVFQKLMMPAIQVLTKVEMVGMWTDEARLQGRADETWEKITKLEKYMRSFVPKDRREDFNFNSPQQLAWLMFEHLELPIIEETGAGHASTKESVLLRLQRRHEFPAALLKHRKWMKRWTTYFGPWQEMRDERGRIHTNYKAWGTVTGRLSSERPNLQQVPRDPFMRAVFGAPSGWKFVEADFSQIELRIAAMLAREKRMLAAFHRGEDIHLKTAVSTSGLSPDQITSEHRKKAKPINFGFIYGMGHGHFGEYAFDNYGVEFTDAESEQVRSRFFEAYPALRPWHERQKRLVQRYQRVHSPIGRIRHLPDVLSKDKGVRAEAERQAINSPVQSLASDLMLLCMVLLDSLLKPSEARMVGTVHDAILFEVRDEALEKVLPIIKRVMEETVLEEVKRLFGYEITVPIEAEIKVGQYWQEGKVWTPS